MDAETRANLLTTMRGEAFAYAKYMLYADHARRSGQPALADLFERTARTERLEHFAEAADLYGLVGDVIDNLREAIAGESYEVDTLYPSFAQQAAAVGEDQAAARFSELRGDEADHQRAFEDALRRLEATSGHDPRPADE